MQLCSPHVQAAATSAVNAAQSQAGTPTIHKTLSSTQSRYFYRDERNYILRNVEIYIALSPKDTVPGQPSVVS